MSYFRSLLEAAMGGEEMPADIDAFVPADHEDEDDEEEVDDGNDDASESGRRKKPRQPHASDAFYRTCLYLVVVSSCRLRHCVVATVQLARTLRSRAKTRTNRSRARRRKRTTRTLSGRCA